MIEKKNPKMDLEKKRMTFVLIGLVVAIGASIFLINYKSYDEKSTADLGKVVIDMDEEDDVATIEEKRTPPPPPPPPPPPVVVVVEDDVEIEDDFEVEDVEVEEDEEIEIEEVEEIAEDEVLNFAVVEDKPIFPGCEKVSKAERESCFEQGVMKAIQSNFKYPQMAKELGIQGNIFVNFEYGKDGKVRNVKVIRGENKDLKKEAIRLVKALPKVTPAKQRGRATAITFTIPVSFRLN